MILIVLERKQEKDIC